MRTPWQFDNYSFPVNPEKDNGWVYEEVEPEAVAIGATKSTLQWGGRKSGRRQISGWLYGEKALEQYNKMYNWKKNRTVATLVDHLGNSTSARLIKFEAENVVSNTEWKLGRSTWRYNAEFIEY
jgi:hypothetical protein